ncbi:hypothetical protein VCR4J5_200563 [Vibrio crassostreae]|uniref:Uncharacterized protein n=1 Tax=Vibrio crassostreae TaxID=246167 RepID=A0ABM9QV50_9VIBR|nr:hypothetical protein VCRA2119O382_10135 [Vibrio crassostreae]CAK1857109.1 hypothetical protein VCRA2117O380_10135 [Vibrio crassostreae]CAK2428757.1 hypothetical protein VCRA2116O374_190015 [Vibrio crassostreae]CAK2435644.1 hypothetical protein VCRA2113O360_10135 [Vibrio crassostreae]CAK2652082.1 hypothetical protein VCRA2119O385_10134 [Vibrio crassostreae]
MGFCKQCAQVSSSQNRVKRVTHYAWALILADTTENMAGKT